MSTPGDLDELIKEIAVKHHVAIGRDDPILVLHTINHRLLENSAKSQQIQLQIFASQLEALSQRWSQDAKTKSDRTLTAAVSAASESACNLLEEASKTAAALMRAEMVAGSEHLGRVMRRARWIAYFNLGAALLSVVAAGLAMYAMLHRV